MHMMDSGFTNFIRRVYVTIKYRNNWPLRLRDAFDDNRSDTKAALMRLRAGNVIAEIAEVDKMRAELLAKDHERSNYGKVFFEPSPEFYEELNTLTKQRKLLLEKLTDVTIKADARFARMYRRLTRFLWLRDWISRRLWKWH